MVGQESIRASKHHIQEPKQIYQIPKDHERSHDPQGALNRVLYPLILETLEVYVGDRRRFHSSERRRTLSHLPNEDDHPRDSSLCDNKKGTAQYRAP
jgi:hypothetical protein